MAASLSFFACLQGLQRFGSFFSPLSWKKACSPDVQIKGSLQSTHLMLRSWYSESEVAPSSWISSRSDMARSPRVGLNNDPNAGWGHSEVVVPLFKEGPLFSWRVSGVSAGCPRSGGSGCPAKYNYDEIVSRLKAVYSDLAERELQGQGTEN